MAPAGKTTAPAAPEYDFDGWNEDAETAAIAELANAFKYVIVEGTFVGRFSDGEIVKIPLEFEADAITGLNDNLNGVEQLEHILAELGDEDTAKTIMRKPFTQMAACAAIYFEKVEQVTNATLAKFKRVSLGE